MERKPSAREIRAKEYEMCVSKYGNVNRSLKTGIAGLILGNGMLLTVFQTTFPRESNDITKYLTPEHPGFLIVQIIPNVGILFSVLLIMILVDWGVRRKKVVDFGFWLEKNLCISRDKNGHGFFTNVTENPISFYGRIGIVILIFVNIIIWLDFN